MVNVRQIRSARAWLGWSQADLAARAGVGERTVSRIELEEQRAPSEEILRQIQAAFEQSGIEFLFEGKKPVGIRIKA
jgi:transcriptional regulator with XRE-family HTH domain